MQSSTPPREPPLLRRVLEGWRRLGRRIGDAQARLVLSLAYLLVVAPFAIVVRLATDPLALKTGAPKGWRLRPPPTEPPLDRARRQF